MVFLRSPLQHIAQRCRHSTLLFHFHWPSQGIQDLYNLLVSIFYLFFCPFLLSFSFKQLWEKDDYMKNCTFFFLLSFLFLDLQAETYQEDRYMFSCWHILILLSIWVRTVKDRKREDGWLAMLAGRTWNLIHSDWPLRAIRSQNYRCFCVLPSGKKTTRARSRVWWIVFQACILALSLVMLSSENLFSWFYNYSLECTATHFLLLQLL